MTRRFLHRAFALGAVSLACSGAPPSRVAAPNAPETQPAKGATPPGNAGSSVRANALDALVDTGTVRLHIQCAGTGQPTVVFEAGLGLDARAWSLVQPEVARWTRACAYDRAGRGLSGPAPHPHTQRQMASELYALLEKSGEAGPYVLVGHSLGGAIVRWFLEDHPHRVAGMVLVDSTTEDWPAKVLSKIPPEARAEFWQNLRAWEGLEPDATVAGYEALRDAKATLGNRPLVVLTAENPAEDFELRREMQGKLTRLSSNSVHLVVQRSAHNIPMDKPDVVIGSVRAVLDAVRLDSRVVQNAKGLH